MGKLLVLLLIFLVPVADSLPAPGWQCSAPCPAPSTRGEMGRLDTFDLDMDSYCEDYSLFRHFDGTISCTLHLKLRLTRERGDCGVPGVARPGQLSSTLCTEQYCQH